MRTCRTDTERRIVALAGSMEGWTSNESAAGDDRSLWFVTPPLLDGVGLGRVVVVGSQPDEDGGNVEPTAISRNRAAAQDEWQIAGEVFLSGGSGADADPLGDPDDPAQVPWRTKQAVEDAVNDLREMLARNARLAIDGWPFTPAVCVLSAWEGPWFSHGDVDDPIGSARFTISCSAQLRADS